MARADLEAAAAYTYPDRPWAGITIRRDEERAAYIQGRLDQAEADAGIAEADAEKWSALHADSDQEESMIGRRYRDYRDSAEAIAAAIRKGVE